VQASTEKQRKSVVGPNGIARSEGGSSSSCQGKLRLFVDSANVNTWRQWLPSGTFYGLFFKLILCCKPPPVKENFGCLLILQMLILGDSGCLQAPFMVCFSN